MRGKLRVTAYLAAVAVVGILVYGYWREHALVVQRSAQASRPRMVAFLVSLLVALVTVGLVCVLQLKRTFKIRAERWMLQATEPVEPVAELQEAERARAAGEPLEAIRLLRDYLQAHPYELHAMARIAEIYRYDLRNDLAAALEYEELLKHPLPADRWSWAALHLAKLYGRLNELDKSIALLERIDAEYSHTTAGRRAKKALDRVRNPEANPVEDEEADAEG
jgi:tetratricopeptide (TPR) repeat protein